MKKIFGIQFILVFIFFFSIETDARPKKSLAYYKKELVKYYESKKYNRDVKKKLDKLWKKLRRVTVQKNSALVFDIDDTLISSYEANKKFGFGNLMVCDPNFVYKGDFKAIPAAKEFYDKVVKHGFKIFLISNRENGALMATEENLRDQGFTHYEKAYLRDYAATKSISSGRFKQIIRNRIIEQGYDIIATIGDQESDCEGSNTGFCITLPNYMYSI
ncbi:MAG TPA: HAD family acid phosphatase [Candidatus Babeliales bacterium]|nr:HAD family acid phosphatase [Candidatus Babeliales bacterium]